MDICVNTDVYIYYCALDVKCSPIVPHFEHLVLSYFGTVAESLGAGPLWKK